MTLSYAIDFGTTNTVITRWNEVNQQPEIVTLSDISWGLGKNLSLIPSLLYVKDAQNNQLFLGQEVMDKGLDIRNDPRFFAGFKRGIGATIQGFLPEIDATKITFEQLGTWFLQDLLRRLQSQTEETPESLVLTVPVDSFESYRNWLTQVCQSWSVGQIQLLDEPTAAALGYGQEQVQMVLVVDFGGGTLDLSLVKLPRNATSNSGLMLKWGNKLLGKNSPQKLKTAQVLAKAGTSLGGSDLDTWLVDYFAQTQGLPTSTLITRLCERLKIKLSQEDEAKEVYFNDETLDTYELSLSRQTFESILTERGFFRQLDELMQQVLQQAKRNGVESQAIEAILLVGGTVQIPAVQSWIENYFPPTKIKREQPLTAIARGALQVAQGLQVTDFLYHSYGIRYWNRQTQAHAWHPLIESGQAYPMSEPVELYLGASWENQPSIELVLGELGIDNSGTEVYFDGDRLVTRPLAAGITQVQPLNDQPGAKTIAQLQPSGYPGSDRLKVQFWVDERRFLRIKVEDLLTETILVDNQPVIQLT